MSYGYRRSKYGVRADPKGIEERTVDNIVFHSKREAIRYRELMASYRAGIIRDLELQPKFPLVVNGVKVCTYVADFKYTACDTGRVTIEDVKGHATALYGLKKKLFQAVYPNLRITES